MVERFSGRGARGELGHGRRARPRRECPADLGKRTCARWRNEAQRVGELGGLLAGCGTEQLQVGARRTVARRKHGLIGEGIGRIADAPKATPVSLEHAHERGVRPCRDLRHLFGGRRAERAELQLAIFIAHVDAVERERVEVDIEPQRAVGRDGADTCVVDRRPSAD